MNPMVRMAVAWMLALSGEVHAASFDCAKAQTQVEKLICSDAELSRLDEELTATYAVALKMDDKAASIRQAQQQWLKRRNDCSDRNCLIHTYVMRIASFSAEPEYGHCVDVHKDDPRQCGNVISGKGYGVCEAYLQHLNSLNRTPLCEIPVPSKFKKLDWKDVDVLQHLDWAYKIDITYAKPAEWIPPDFESWRETFLEKLRARKIKPHMRQVRIKPLATDDAFIIAYTRDRLACGKEYQKDYQESKWAAGGYVYWELTGNPANPLRKFGDGDQGELLLFAGKPYFVHSYDPTWNPSFYIHQMFAHQQHDDGLHYETMQLCALERFPAVNASIR